MDSGLELDQGVEVVSVSNESLDIESQTGWVLGPPCCEREVP